MELTLIKKEMQYQIFQKYTINLNQMELYSPQEKNQIIINILLIIILVNKIIIIKMKMIMKIIKMMKKRIIMILVIIMNFHTWKVLKIN